MNITKYNWDHLATMLRKEIEEYGGLFSILEDQRESLLKSNLDGIHQANHELEHQAQLIYSLRGTRLDTITELAKELGMPEEEGCTVKRLIQEAPESVQPMFESIIKEVERLVHATRNYLKRNQMLIRRATDMNRQFLTVLNPDGNHVASYRRNGVLANSERRGSGSNYLIRA